MNTPLRVEHAAPNLRNPPQALFAEALSSRCARCVYREDLIEVGLMLDRTSARDTVTLCAWCLAEAIQLATGWRMLSNIRQNIKIRGANLPDRPSKPQVRKARHRRASATA